MAQSQLIRSDFKHTIGQRKKKYFSRHRKPKTELPNLFEGQLNSFKELIDIGLKEVFDEFSSITDYSNKKFELKFGQIIFEDPKLSSKEARFNHLTYEAPLKIRATLINKTLGTEKEQEIFLADFPLMTRHGTFIINGVERVIVPQLARSYGILFTKQLVRNHYQFGSKIIPSRGAWIELETDLDDVVYIRIDRNRKFPITTFLRILGAGSDEAILKLFKKDEKAALAIKKTLDRDPIKTVNEAYVDIYKRLRDGDLATLENAKEFVDSILSELRYDLSEVGRFKFNKRFGLPVDKKALTKRIIDVEDFVIIISHVIELNHNPNAEEDDIDHLGSRRVRFVGELLQQKIRTGMAQMKRNIQNRMSTIDTDATLPANFIAPRPLQARIKEFFTTNQLSQFMQQENLLTETEHLRTVSALGPGGLQRGRAGLEVRDVHPSHYGRVCPIHTPEGQNIGLILRFSCYARTNKYGMIETPYLKVEKGKVTKEIVYMNAHDEEGHVIAHAATSFDEDEKFVDKYVSARLNGEPVMVKNTEVAYLDIAPNQAFSIATSMIPFLDHDDANRALMASNMQKQAVPLLTAEAPIVATGTEETALIFSNRVLRADQAGIVQLVDARKITIKNEKGKIDEYELENFRRTNNFTSFHHRPVVNVGDKVKKGDLLADTSTSDNGQISLGKNLLVAFMSWSGSNYEDAIIISERLVKDDVLTSIHLEEVVVNVRDTKLGPEVTTSDIPNVSDTKLKDLDEEGIVRIGAEVRPGDILIGKITPKGEAQLTPEERLLRSIFGDKARDVKDSSRRAEGGLRGRVVGVKVFSRENGDKLDSGIIKRIHIEIAQLRPITVGDKLAGRHGNKGVISKVLPVEDMPYSSDGTPVDIILTPLGVPSRMNLGQILELHLGLAANSLDYQAICPAFSGATVEEIRKELTEAGFSSNGKMPLYDGRTGEKFDQDISVGYMYMLKLHHMVEDKLHMRSIGPYSLITQQPLGGKAQNGGQRFGEMEVWALLGHGAAHTLREVLTYKSDDIVGRSAAFDSIVKGEPITQTNVPASFNVLVNNIRGLALDIDVVKSDDDEEQIVGHRRVRHQHIDKIFLKVASPERILEWSHGEVTRPETVNYRTQRSEKNGLFDQRIFGPEKDYECYCGKYRGIRYKGIVCEKCGVEVTRSIVRRDRMGHIQLASPVSHIWFLRSMPSRISLILGMNSADVEKVIYFAAYLVTKVDDSEKKRILSDLESEFKTKTKSAQDQKTKDRLKDLYQDTKKEIEEIVRGKVLDEIQYHKYSMKYGALFEAEIGAEAIYNIFKAIKLEDLLSNLEKELKDASSVSRDKLNKRISLIKSMIKSKIRPEWMFLSYIPVIPPALRPMVALDGGRQATSDVNDLYRRVINRNNRLKKLQIIGAPEVILRNEKRILQEAVDALIDNTIRHTTSSGMMNSAQKRPLKSLADNLKGKRGLFRGNLLGKRVDYSGRSVIVIGPNLALNQCGLPKHMALELFKPFIISELLKKELAFNIRGASRMIDDGAAEVWEILEEVIKGKYVLLNRAPTLHRLGIQAFQPVLIEGQAIQVHPLVCTAFNADFDGDQMAVHVPLSVVSQYEAREIMAADKNILKPGSGEPVVAAKLLDILLGCFWITKAIKEEQNKKPNYFPGPNTAMTAYDYGIVSLRSKVVIRNKPGTKYETKDSFGIETTIGRIMFNAILPDDYPFINEEINKKRMAILIDDLINKYGINEIPKILDKIKEFGFKYATKSGVTWAIDDLVIPEQKHSIIQEATEKLKVVMRQYNEGLLSGPEKKRKLTAIWHEAKNKIESFIPGTFDENSPIYDMWKSGARGSLGQITNMAGMKGLIVNSKGEEIETPVLSCSKEGFSPIEYFTSTHGSRKGLTDTALNTAKAGYLTRRLFDVAQDVVINELDCGTKKSIKVVRKTTDSGIDVPLANRIRGRVLASDVVSDGKVIFKKGHLVSKKDAAEIEVSGAEFVEVRSPLTCKSKRGVCAHCYGSDLGRDEMVDLGEAVGTVAAQAIGEPGTQLTMRTFHAGGTAVVGGDITQGLPRVDEVFERRKPKSPAIISKCDGIVSEIKDEKKDRIVIISPSASSKNKKQQEYKISKIRTLLIKEGDEITKGQILTDGSADLSELYKYTGREKTEEYVIGQINRIYELQGEPVSRKHIEIIVRQMFSRVKILNEGDSIFTVGDVVNVDDFEEENKKLEEAGKLTAKSEPVLLGITEVSLSRKSFLSAASFQHTTKVLINSAIRGAEDNLNGLKENVILGRLIPAGTGFEGSKKHKAAKAIEEDAISKFQELRSFQEE